ncbi:MAG: monomeric [FeFe] hydrogenase [Bacilli bacterium]|nr:monomeric [FeFe] hydrogenase [Bacilli bacterium]
MRTYDSYNQNKIKVLKEVAVECYNGGLESGFENKIAKQMFPSLKAETRCCVFKEREIVKERAYMAAGKKPDGSNHNGKQTIYVMEAACNDCDVHKVRITDNCHKCLARSCERACHFDAIYMGNSKAHINYEKCKECGMCTKVCAFSAIAISERPCKKVCPTGALKHVKDNIAMIDEDLCINCGLCAVSCPFGAISDISYMSNVIRRIVNGEEVIAIVAPAVQGQFETATLDQIFESIRMLGFKDVIEVALGADLVSYAESQEFFEKLEEGKFMTTSCCPAFVELMKKKFPKIYEENTSTVVSPMIATARYVKKNKPNAKVVFIGPCFAKKEEARLEKYKGLVDYVLTFEELIAMLGAKDIEVKNVVPTKKVEDSSVYGRRYCFSGGIIGAIKEYMKEKGIERELTFVQANGSVECLEVLKQIQQGKLKCDFVEGMICPGGCGAGGCTLSGNINVLKMKNEKENKAILEKTLLESVEKINADIEMHYEK